MSLSYRLAAEKDVWALLALYQKVGSTLTEDPLFLDYDKLRAAVTSDDSVWLLAERAGEIQCMVSMLVDRSQGLAKISRLMVNPGSASLEVDLRASLRNALSQLRASEPGVEAVFTTTRSLPRKFQDVTLSEGFTIAGVFPNSLGVDGSTLNGITVFYFEGVLRERRMADIVVHPAVRPFFELAAEGLGLPPVGVAKQPPAQASRVPVPPLELLKAPLLAGRRFERLQDNQSAVIHFYPFNRPNVLVANPDETVEVYCKIVEPLRLAAVIGEHLEAAVDPVGLYESLSRLLRSEGVSYIEVINDAADVLGTQCLLDAGFTPCAYLPAFKRQGESRRDYVVFGKSFEAPSPPESDLHPRYLAFFREYARLRYPAAFQSAFN